MSQGNILNNDSKDELKKSTLKENDNPINNSVQSKKEIKTKLSKEIFMKKLNESKEFQKMKSLQNKKNIEYDKINEFDIKNEIRVKTEEEINKNFIKEEIDEKNCKKLKDDLLPNKIIEIYNKEKENIESIDEKNSFQNIENIIEKKKNVNFEDEINKHEENELNKNINKNDKDFSKIKKLTKLDEKIKEKIEKRLELYKNRNNNNNNNSNNNDEALNFESKINKNKFRPIEKSYTINNKAKILQKLILGKNPDIISDKDLDKKDVKNIDNLINEKPTIIKKKKKTYKPFILSNEL